MKIKQNKNIWVVNAEKFILNLGLWCLTPLSTIFSYIIAFSFIGGRNRRSTCKLLSMDGKSESM
jgi:hypothetical protein